jgi:hypothetical protein
LLNTTTFANQSSVVEGNRIVMLTTGDYPSECRWDLKSSTGRVVAYGLAPDFQYNCGSVPSPCQNNESRLIVFDMASAGWFDGTLDIWDCNDDPIIPTVNLPERASGAVFSQCILTSSLSNGFKLFFDGINFMNRYPEIAWVIADQHNNAGSTGNIDGLTRCSAEGCIDPRMGNGICDDDLNISPCWDGGDCCRYSCQGDR